MSWKLKSNHVKGKVQDNKNPKSEHFPNRGGGGATPNPNWVFSFLPGLGPVRKISGSGFRFHRGGGVARTIL